ncbi:MAG: hypothetical protein AAF591_19960 [Verrucomicrobiota bacterium]
MKEESAAINFRLSRRIKDEVDEVSGRFGLTATDLIRIAITEKLDEIERSGKLEIQMRGGKKNGVGKKGKGKKGKKD